MKPFVIGDEALAQFEQDGYLFVPHLYDAQEMDLLLKIGKADEQKKAAIHAMADKDGGTSKLWLTSDIDSDDIYNGFCHGRRIVDTMEKLFGDEVYLYHYKMMVKEPRVGGAWEWHQDYGYWYNDKCLYPDMASCYIAVDRAHKENGCLQVLRGSHHLGRLTHGHYGDQAGADPERVALAMERLELVYCEMEPGAALFFHANLLHRSDANRSEDPRWSLICCYNTRHNAPHDRSGNPVYRTLEKWDDSQIKELGIRQWSQLQTGINAVPSACQESLRDASKAENGAMQ